MGQYATHEVVASRFIPSIDSGAAEKRPTIPGFPTASSPSLSHWNGERSMITSSTIAPYGPATLLPNKRGTIMNRNTNQMKRLLGIPLIACGMALCCIRTPLAAALSPELKCQVSKNKLAGRLADCRQKVEAARVEGLNAFKVSQATENCRVAFFKKFQALNDKAFKNGLVCPDNNLSASSIDTVTADHTSNIAAALGGSGLRNFVVEPNQCQGALNNSNQGLNQCQAQLNQTQTQLNQTQTQLNQTETQLNQTQTQLNQCQVAAAEAGTVTVFEEL